MSEGKPHEGGALGGDVCADQPQSDLTPVSGSAVGWGRRSGSLKSTQVCSDPFPNSKWTKGTLFEISTNILLSGPRPVWKCNVCVFPRRVTHGSCSSQMAGADRMCLGTWEGRKGRCPAVLLLLSTALGEASVYDRGHEGPGRPAGGLETSVLSWLAGCVAVGTCQDPEARATQSDGHASATCACPGPAGQTGPEALPPEVRWGRVEGKGHAVLLYRAPQSSWPVVLVGTGRSPTQAEGRAVQEVSVFVPRTVLLPCGSVADREPLSQAAACYCLLNKLLYKLLNT